MKRGFTIIELMTVLAIIAIFSSLFLFNFQGFGGRVTAESVANEVAGSIRQAQVWGTSTRVIQDANPDDGIGIHFETGNNLYQIFVDKNVDDSIDSGEELVDYNIPSSLNISEICAGTESNCDSSSDLDLLTRRPNLGFIINGGSDSYAEITLESNSGMDMQKIKIWASGKFEVE